MGTVIAIDDSYNQSVYTIKLDGTKITVTVTSVASVVRKWLNSTLFLRRKHVQMNQLVVGLGVQWTPGGYNAPANTLQLCIGRRCLIFQLSQAEFVPQRLRTFLQDPDHRFVGFWNHSDRRKLMSSEHGLEMRNYPLDLRMYGERLCGENLARASVKKIVKKCLGYEVEQSREISMSDWSQKDLNKDQVVYACVDAYCAFLMGKNLRAWKM
ncbi:uncharacterized protein [Cicer arietinum]|uniref:Uncharacterized protein LOC105851827 n=1 Tax=Cicer arietinum TaxID=3827 RepID=A0A1S3E1A4_CICAR|nr:uncharacterized protein LOC105851827 [Cicer arietinum]